MSESITKADLQSAVENAIREAAPLVDAKHIVNDWLYHNGIAFVEMYGTWFFQDNRLGFEGRKIDENRFTYAEALTFALEFVKQHIQEQAVAEKVGE